MIRSLIDLLRNLQSEEDCRLFLENIRWHGVPVCPHCGSKSEEHYKLTNGGIFRGLYKCKDCRERFTVTVGTMFEGSHIPLQKMLCCVILLMFNLLQRLKICWGTIWGRNFAGQKKKRANIKLLFLPYQRSRFPKI